MKRRDSILLVIFFLFLLFSNTEQFSPKAPVDSISGKTISILGDSISTYEEWIPDGNRVYYTGEICGVSSVEDTWWMKAITTLDLQLCVNNSWSGSRVTTTASDVSAGCGNRCISLHREGQVPDIIIIYMGINDFDHNIPTGSYNGKTTNFRSAYSIMLEKITATYPAADIYACTLPYSNAAGTLFQPITSNRRGETLVDYNNVILELVELFNINCIDFANCGITSQNMHMFLGDYSADTNRGLHPNKYGHTLLANEAIYRLCPSFGKQAISLFPDDF